MLFGISTAFYKNNRINARLLKLPRYYQIYTKNILKSVKSIKYNLLNSWHIYL